MSTFDSPLLRAAAAIPLACCMCLGAATALGRAQQPAPLPEAQPGFELAVPAAATAQAEDRGSEQGGDVVRAALDRLWPKLEHRHLDRPRWERAATSASRTLTGEHGAELAAIIQSEASSPLERTAAAELLRRLGPNPQAELGEPELGRLRRIAFDGIADSAVASAARRTLVDLGDWSDRVRLVRELDSAVSVEERDAAGWCLRAVRGPEVLPDLAALLDNGAPAGTVALAAASAEAVLRSHTARHDPRRDPAGVTGLTTNAAWLDQSTELAEHALAALDAPFCHPEVKQRLCSLLGALQHPQAWSRLEALTREGYGPAARALSATAPGRSKLEATARDTGASEAARLAASAALAAEPAADEAQRALAIERLAQITERGLEPSHSLLAVLALVPIDDARAHAALARVRASDPALATATGLDR